MRCRKPRVPCGKVYDGKTRGVGASGNRGLHKLKFRVIGGDPTTHGIGAQPPPPGVRIERISPLRSGNRDLPEIARVAPEASTI